VQLPSRVPKIRDIVVYRSLMKIQLIFSTTMIYVVYLSVFCL